MDCHICGERKPKPEFKKIMYFSSYTRRNMIWCQDCQKMYIAMKKEKEAEEKLANAKFSFLVGFQ